MSKNKSSRNPHDNNDFDSTRKRLIKKRNNATYDDGHLIVQSKKLKKYSLRIAKNNNSNEADFETFYKTFNSFKEKNVLNKSSDFTVDTCIFYTKALAIADDFVTTLECKLEEFVAQIISSKTDNNDEIYISEFNDVFFKENNLFSITITRNKSLETSSNTFNFIFVPICAFKYSLFDIIFEKSCLSVGKMWLLPNKEFNGLWESLEFSSDVKEELLDYCNASLKFSNSQVNHKIISYNRLIFFHGSPGCGKTSLAKAFSQKLSMRYIGDYKCYKLIDINSNFLLSEYYSQSGKLLTLVFQKLKELSSCSSDTFYIVLIDEIETLLTSRDLHASNSNEPLDSLRAVNVILTQLDQIKKFKNILIIATSNLSEMLDSAFLDRADLKFYIKQPSLKGIYKIYMACINELIKKNLLPMFDTNMSMFNKLMYKLCKESGGLSGRLLRKLPFLAYCKLDSLNIETFIVTLLNEIKLFKENKNTHFAD